MKSVGLMLLVAIFVAPAAWAAVPGAVTDPIHQFIDGFNTGDTKSAYAAYAGGEISIIDEFPPHRWMGAKAAQLWAADYDKHAKEAGVSDGHVGYGAPARTEIEGDVAYVIVPTLYTYKAHGKATAEEGQMTFALTAGTGGWKIKSWTWTGVEPHPAR